MITMKLPYQDIVNRWNYSSSAHARITPLTCTVDYANNNKFSQVDVDNSKLRGRMKELLDIILRSFELQNDIEEVQQYDI